MRKAGLVAAIAFVLIAAALVLVPFDRPQPRGGVTYGPGFTTHCSSPVVAAWRVEHDAGWFGYTPLTSTPVSTPVSFPTCRGAARHRLAWGSAFLVGAVLLALVLRRRKADVASADDAPTGQ